MGRATLRLLLRPLPLLGLPRPDLGNPLGDRDLEALLRLGGVVEALDHHARQPLADRPLDLVEVALLFRRHEGEGVARGVGPRSPAFNEFWLSAIGTP